ncbi:MAG TPA: ABC transporter ATP-binding protein [Gemmatimonadaceae bacterium]|nr:ABC transporter ATP-binding protein [Gemmatimonadaceae bacterium]
MTMGFASLVGSLENLAGYSPDPERRPPSISIRNLVKEFPKRRSATDFLTHPFANEKTRVLHSISLDVAEGELFGILGLNGAGKTTLLRILATILLPDGGNVSVGNHDLETEPQLVKEFAAMVSADERSLNWRLSGFENLRLFAGLHQLAKRQAATRVVDTLALVGLADAGKKLVGSYSSGMRQRLLLARALLPAPRLLLMDEPTRSLDPVSAHEFRRMLKSDIVDAGRATVVLATHNAEEAFGYCDRVAVLHHGSIAALGTGFQLSSRYEQRRYRITTQTPDHPAFEMLLRAGSISALVRRTDGTDELSVECTVVGDDDAAAEVLKRLIEQNVRVSAFEKAPLTLSTLIARIAAEYDVKRGAANA